MKIRELMTTDVRSVQMGSTLQEVAQQMEALDVGIIPVATNNRLDGVITDRDIVVRAVAKGMDINATTASECMSTGVITVTQDTDAHEAAKLMATHQIRRLPVVDGDNNLTGIVAIGDLAVVGIHENEAGFALSEISEPTRPDAHDTRH